MHRTPDAVPPGATSAAPAGLRARRPGLDLLRAIAIIWVMLFHSFVVGGLGDDFAWLSRFGWMGVDLFFVLSGYLIGRQVLAPMAGGAPFSFGDFYARRAFRILPAFGAVLALYLAFPWFREAPGMAPWWSFASFTMNMTVDYGTQAAFSHAWSLCVEEHFYLLFPLLAVWMMRVPSQHRLVALCACIVLAGMAIRGGVWLHDTAVDPPRNWFVEDIYYPTWTRLDGLLAGVVLAAVHVFRPAWWRRAGAHANAVLLAGIGVVAVACWLFADRVGLLGNVVGWPVLSLGLALLVFAGAQPHGWIGRRRMPGAAWLASISFSLYLMHKAAFHMLHAQFGDQLAGQGIRAFGAYALAAVAAGALLYYAVERPGLSLRRRWLAGPRMEQAATW